MEREKVVKILKYYNDIDGDIHFVRLALNDYEEMFYGLHGGNTFGSGATKTNKISNPTEAAALNIPDSTSEFMSVLRSKIERLNKLKAEIFTELCKLPLVEKNILTYFYFKGFQWVQISSRVHYSETQCKNIRNKALEKLGGFFEQNEFIKNFNYPI